MAAMTRFSVLDLVPVREGSDVSAALADAAELAAHVEALGYHRLWVAEHHGMPGIASAATAVGRSSAQAPFLASTASAEAGGIGASFAPLAALAPTVAAGRGTAMPRAAWKMRPTTGIFV